MQLRNIVLLTLSLAYTSLGQEQHPIGTERKKDAYNITLNFDDIATNDHGVGFSPKDPKQKPYIYKDLHLQSFTLLNASSANLTGLDKRCSRSWPNSIFAHRRDGYAWPRISLHDLSKPAEELREDVHKSDKTFGLVSLWIKPTGNLTGAYDRTFGIISVTMMRLDPDPRSDIPPEAGFPGIVRGEPLPLAVGNLTGIGVFFPPGAHDGLAIDLRSIFGPEFGTGVDVMEVTADILRQDKGSYYFHVAEDWEVCLDDIKLEIVQKDVSKPIVNIGSFAGMRLDGARVGPNDPEWEALQALTDRRFAI